MSKSGIQSLDGLGAFSIILTEKNKFHNRNKLLIVYFFTYET
jgi:hypothetical protein